MKILRQIAVAFSLYSAIPMPRFTWEEEDYKNNLIFLPFVGLVIGVASIVLYKLLMLFNVPLPAITLFMCLVPVVLTGGFHIDGFMDVCDAIKSYAPKEKKLEILKDPHIGAFAVIGLIKYGLFYIGLMYIVIAKATSTEDIYLVGLSYVLSRCLCSYISINFKHAKNEGMLEMETKLSNRRESVIIVIETLITLALFCWINVLIGAAVTLVLFLYGIYYKHKCLKNFGGITGDMSGYYILLNDVLIIGVIGVFRLLGV